MTDEERETLTEDLRALFTELRQLGYLDPDTQKPRPEPGPSR